MKKRKAGKSMKRPFKGRNFVIPMGVKRSSRSRRR